MRDLEEILYIMAMVILTLLLISVAAFLIGYITYWVLQGLAIFHEAAK